MDVAEALHGLIGSGSWARRMLPVHKRAYALFSGVPTATREELEQKRTELYERAWRWFTATPYGSQVSDRNGFPGLSREMVNSAAGQFTTNHFGLAAHTGGSSGVPLKLKRSLMCIAVEQAAIDFVLGCAGIKPQTARVAVLRAQSLGKDAAGKLRVARQVGRRLLYLSPYALTEGSIRDYADALDRFRPDVLMAYPSAVENLVSLLALNGIRCRIPVVMTSSEVLYPHARDTISLALGARVVDFYGNGERVAAAYSSDEGEYWFMPLYGGVQLALSESGANVGGKVVDLFEIIGTSFWNPSMPLYKYSTGDLAVLPHGLDSDEILEVELGKRPFLGVLGRVAEWVTLRSGARAIGLNHLPWGVPGLKRMQIVEHGPGEITVVLDVEQEAAEDACVVVRQNVQRLVGDDVALSIEVGRSFMRSVSGKVPFVVRREHT